MWHLIQTTVCILKSLNLIQILFSISISHFTEYRRECPKALHRSDISLYIESCYQLSMVLRSRYDRTFIAVYIFDILLVLQGEDVNNSSIQPIRRKKLISLTTEQ
uniref:DnaJ N-terminal domain/ferredoxin fusion protein n=1 Tax=uncultured haloarchaeon TaxID=160804 RepID=A5YSF7_9EURY|nr:dnaJ N-terminal domain/ferredoxin fusion protein [uncultured haloarchaeon]